MICQHCDDELKQNHHCVRGAFCKQCQLKIDWQKAIRHTRLQPGHEVVFYSFKTEELKEAAHFFGVPGSLLR